MSSTTEKITLGSGEMFILEFAGELPTTEEICVPENRLGHVSGGAVLEYTPSYYTARDDLGVVSKTIVMEEEATLKSGILAFNGETLTRLTETGRVSEDGNVRAVKIGGIKNSYRKSFVITFRVHDATDAWVQTVGRDEPFRSAANQEAVLQDRCHGRGGWQHFHSGFVAFGPLPPLQAFGAKSLAEGDDPMGESVRLRVAPRGQ